MKIEVVKEIRFAVVMYGGVSLAIYINGVAQEILRMVRATAVGEDGSKFRVPDEELTAVESVYRDLAYLIADKSLFEDKDLLEGYCDWLTKRRPHGDNPLTAKLREQAADGKNVKAAGFIVDILSGSSAGGINGVYMAKAIVGGQSLSALENLWCSEGNFSKLLNDEQSIVDEIEGQTVQLGLKKQEPPRSLLNSERMYLKLLTAFYQMDKEPLGESFIDEVDLFVTLTDYWGIPVPLRLFDQLIHERRHRQNLHFRFRRDDGINDFDESVYPFLAFSARCTSSFPMAFDPMQLKKANEIIEQVNAHKNNPAANFGLNPISETLWKRSFKPQTVQDADGNQIEIKWNERVFVDGGYLDNKPFGYAITALAQKQSDVLVDRKLIYIEPQPDLDDSYERATRTTPPFALENTLAALTEMPRYETIREDLQQVLQRNRLITRINQIVTDARKDELESLRLSFENLDDIISQHKKTTETLIKKYGDKTPDVEEKTITWERLNLGEIAQQKGQIAYPYYRLRIAALTDHLAQTVTHRAGYDEDSDYFLAVRDLVYVWRKKKFSRGEETEKGDRQSDRENLDKPTPMLFLRDYDFDYRLRRLRFVLQQADRLLQFDTNLRQELERTKEIADGLRTKARPGGAFTMEEKKALQTRFPLIEIGIYDFAAPSASETILEHQNEKLRQTVRSFKKAVNEILREFRKDMAQVQPNSNLDPDNANKDLIETLNLLVGDTAKEIQIRDLEFLLGKSAGQDSQLNARDDIAARRKRAEEFLKDRDVIEKKLNEIGETLRKIYNGDETFSIFSKSRTRIYELFNSDKTNSLEQKKVRKRLQANAPDEIYTAVREYLQHFYENFDAYDQIVFPVTYETPIGEAAIIDVARISPLDAPSLIDEAAEHCKEKEELKDDRLTDDERYKARRKVAGGVFSAFGAFFAEDWRKNDILWGRLDAVERLVSIILNDSLITKSGKLQGDDLRESLGKVRRAMIEELQETILQESDLIKAAFKKLHRRDPTEADKLTDFIKIEYAIERDLPKESVSRVTVRSISILRKVLGVNEFGKLNKAKDFALDALGLMLVPKAEGGTPHNVLRKFVPNLYLFGGILVILLPILILAFAVWLSVGLSPFWFVTGGLIVMTAIYAAISFIGYRKSNKIWEQSRSFISSMIYSKVTGVEKK